MASSSETAFDFLGRLKVASGASLSSILLQLLQTLRLRDGRNSGAVAVQVAAFFRTLLSTVSSSKSTTVDAIIDHLTAIEERLAAAAGMEFLAPNVARRVLCFVREEADKKVSSSSSAGLLRAGSSLAGADAVTVGSDSRPGPIGGLAATDSNNSGPAGGTSSAVADARSLAASTLASLRSKSVSESSGAKAARVTYGPGLLFSSIRGGVLDAVNELLDELDTSATTITSSAVDVCNHGDVLLACGYDATVRDFILAAAKKKRVAEVIIAEASDAEMLHVGNAAGAPPVFAGHALAMELTSRAKPIPVTVIPDATVGAVMHRVSRVLIGARGIARDGSVAADSPASLLALAAREAKVPVVVVSNALRVIAADDVRTEAELERLAEVAGQADPHAVLPRSAFEAAEVAFAAAATTQAALSVGAADVAAVEVMASGVDVLPASAIALIITNTGILAPSAPSGRAQVERIYKELYG